MFFLLEQGGTFLEITYVVHKVIFIARYQVLGSSERAVSANTIQVSVDI